MAYTYTDAAFNITAKQFVATDDGFDLNVPYSYIDHAVLHVLCHRADRITGYCYTGYKDLADRAHVSRDAAMDAVETLEMIGFIEVHRNGKGTNGYTVNLDRLIEAATQQTVTTPIAARGKLPSKKFLNKLKGVKNLAVPAMTVNPDEEDELL